MARRTTSEAGVDHGGARAPAVVQQSDIPDAIRPLSAVLEADYVDVFSMSTPGHAVSPEQWARAGIEDAAGVQGQFVWRVLLGLRLERRQSPSYVGGWKIADRGDDWLRLEAASWFLTAHIVVHVDERCLSIATLIHYDQPVAKAIWPPVSVGHRWAMPGLLRGALRSLERAEEPVSSSI
jgi:hypothetical protein